MKSPLPPHWCVEPQKRGFCTSSWLGPTLAMSDSLRGQPAPSFPSLPDSTLVLPSPIQLRSWGHAQAPDAGARPSSRRVRPNGLLGESSFIHLSLQKHLHALRVSIS